MVGVIVATHGPLARALLTEAFRIVGPCERAVALEISTTIPLAELRRRFERAVSEVDDGGGTLVMVDLLGGTPCNLGLPLCDGERVEVVTGTNLPMVLRALLKKDELGLRELAQEVAAYGVRAIGIPSRDRRRDREERGKAG